MHCCSLLRSFRFIAIVEFWFWKRKPIFMKTFIMACAAAVVIAVVGSVVLNSVPDSVEHAFSSSTGVRLGV